jgi:hypothetical protein
MAGAQEPTIDVNSMVQPFKTALQAANASIEDLFLSVEHAWEPFKRPNAMCFKYTIPENGEWRVTVPSTTNPTRDRTWKAFFSLSLTFQGEQQQPAMLLGDILCAHEVSPPSMAWARSRVWKKRKAAAPVNATHEDLNRLDREVEEADAEAAHEVGILLRLPPTALALLLPLLHTPKATALAMLNPNAIFHLLQAPTHPAQPHDARPAQPHNAGVPGPSSQQQEGHGVRKAGQVITCL